MKKVFKLPVSWSVFGIVEIEAESLDEAIQIFKDTEDDIPLPMDNDYVDGSFKLYDEETAGLLNGGLL